VSAERLFAAARAYAERLGWAVLPQKGKIPAAPRSRGGRGYLTATVDLASIEHLWREYPGANIGVSCVGSGFVALDIDVRYGGDETLRQLESAYGALPRTPRQITGGGGQHILFRPPAGFKPTSKLSAGIDVKWRGCITCSPSVHPDTGRSYRWQRDCHPLETPIAALPAWVADLTRPKVRPSPTATARPAIEEATGWGPYPRYSRRALEQACIAIERSPIGEQEKTLSGQAYSIGRLVGGGLMPRQLALDCLAYAGGLMLNASGRRPWQQHEIRSKVERALQAGECRPREVGR
jgi:hypothetical protein